MLLAAVIAGGGERAPAEAGAKSGKMGWRGAEGGKDPAPGDTALIQGRIC